MDGEMNAFNVFTYNRPLLNLSPDCVAGSCMQPFMDVPKARVCFAFSPQTVLLWMRSCYQPLCSLPTVGRQQGKLGHEKLQHLLAVTLAPADCWLRYCQIDTRTAHALLCSFCAHGRSTAHTNECVQNSSCLLKTAIQKALLDKARRVGEFYIGE